MEKFILKEYMNEHFFVWIWTPKVFSQLPAFWSKGDKIPVNPGKKGRWRRGKKRQKQNESGVSTFIHKVAWKPQRVLELWINELRSTTARSGLVEISTGVSRGPFYSKGLMYTYVYIDNTTGLENVIQTSHG